MTHPTTDLLTKVFTWGNHKGHFARKVPRPASKQLSKRNVKEGGGHRKNSKWETPALSLTLSKAHGYGEELDRNITYRDDCVNMSPTQHHLKRCLV